jgi:hypothetical protein
MRAPDDGVGEHLLGLPPPERVEVAAAIAVDGVGGEDSTEGGEQRVAQCEEHVLLEPDLVVTVPVPCGGLLHLPCRHPRHRLELHWEINRIRATLRPAEDRMVSNDFVKLWMQELRGAWSTWLSTCSRRSSSRHTAWPASSSSRSSFSGPAPASRSMRSTHVLLFL